MKELTDSTRETFSKFRLCNTKDGSGTKATLAGNTMNIIFQALPHAVRFKLRREEVRHHCVRFETLTTVNINIIFPRKVKQRYLADSHHLLYRTAGSSK